MIRSMREASAGLSTSPTLDQVYGQLPESDTRQCPICQHAGELSIGDVPSGWYVHSMTSTANMISESIQKPRNS
jgi:hypothetical protein